MGTTLTDRVRAAIAKKGIFERVDPVGIRRTNEVLEIIDLVEVDAFQRGFAAGRVFEREQ